MLKGIQTISAALMAVAAVTGLAACGTPQVEKQEVSVTRASITQTISADGELSLLQQRKLLFGVSGRVDQINVVEGDRVKAGQVLLRLDMAPLERTVKSADLAVKLAESDRQQAETGVKVAESDLNQARNGVKVAESDLKQAEFGVQTAEADATQAENAVKNAEADLQIATDNYRKITYPYTYSTFAFDVPQAIESINKSERQMAEAQKMLQKPDITSDQRAQASLQLQQAQENIADARQRLARGQGTDVFANGQQPVTDFWTLRNAEAAAGKARVGVDSSRSLLAKSRLGVEAAGSARDRAELGVISARNLMDKAQSGLDQAKTTLVKTGLAVEKAANDLDTAKAALRDATITAPFDGIVAKVTVKTGDMLTPADYGKTIVDIIDPRRMEVTLKVDETDVPKAAIGQKAVVSIDAVPGYKPEGKVSFISPLPRIDNGIVQYEVRVTLDVAEGSVLKSGMRVSASVQADRKENVLSVPSQAISRDRLGNYVARVMVDGKVQTRTVEIGVTDGQRTEIISGLTDGVSVLMPGQTKNG